MSRREHVLKLPRGFRVDCETVTNRAADTVVCTARAYEGSAPLFERVEVMLGSEFQTVGDLITWRTGWLNDIADEVLS